MSASDPKANYSADENAGLYLFSGCMVLRWMVFQFFDESRNQHVAKRAITSYSYMMIFVSRCIFVVGRLSGCSKIALSLSGACAICLVV